jgi:hypothetical protein
MSRGQQHSETQTQAITANIARGRDVLAALAAAWSSSANQLDPGAVADDAPLMNRPTGSAPESQPAGRASR